MSKEKKPSASAIAARNIRQKCPDDWYTIVSDIRKSACATRMDAELTEAVKAEYHRKSMATTILQKWGEHTGE